MVEPPATPELHPRSRRRSWLSSWYGQPKGLVRDIATSLQDAGPALNQPDRRHTVSFYDAGSSAPRAESGSRVSSRPSTPRSITATSISHFFPFHSTPHPPPTQVDQLSVPHNDSQPTSPPLTSPSVNKGDRPSSSFGKMSFNSMLGGLSSLSLSRTPTGDDRDKESRGRTSNKRKSRASSFVMPSNADPKDSTSVASRTRSQSPFSLSRWRSRDLSPAPLPLEESDSESLVGRRTLTVRPRTAFTDDPDSGSEYAADETEDEDDEWSDDAIGIYDTLTERNTEQNALIAGVAGDGILVGEMDGEADADAAFDPDPLGEGVNVVVPPEPYFPSTLNRTSFSSSRSKRSNPKRKKSRPYVLPLQTSRPVFQRDRCTITITQGDPATFSQRKKMYVVASDLSEESRYAVEWGIGTVLRDGDEMYDDLLSY